jgi:type IV pilus assembly protein PilE
MANHQGFSLTELLIAVSIVGILAMVAYPSYRDYVIRTNRSEAQQWIMEVASREEQYLLDARRYGSCCAPDAAPNELGLTTPSRVSGNYTVVAVPDNAATPPIYTITATPRAGTTQANDGDLSLDSAGNKQRNINGIWHSGWD